MIRWRRSNAWIYSVHTNKDYFGKATQKQAGELAKRFGATKVFVVYGGGSVVKADY